MASRRCILRFESSAPLALATHTIDLGREMSNVLRTHVPQGQMFRINAAQLQDSNNAAQVTLGAMPATSAHRAAYRRGRRLWWDMVERASVGVGNIHGEWLDFRTYLDPAHAQGSASLLTAVTHDGSAWPTGLWEYSTYHTADPDGTAPSFTTVNRNVDSYVAHLLGNHQAGGGAGDTWESVGLVRSWIDTRPTTFDSPQNVPVQTNLDPLANLFDYGDATDEILQDLEQVGDAPPWAYANPLGFNAVEHQRLCVLQATNENPQPEAWSSVSTTQVPCGLLNVRTRATGVEEGIFSLMLDVTATGVNV